MYIFFKRQTQIINSFKIRISDIHKRLNHFGKYVKNSYLYIAEKNDKGMLCFKKMSLNITKVGDNKLLDCIMYC